MVTVLTPTYNRASLLPRLYASLAGQTYKDFEWLVVDDGSDDHTKEVAAGFISQAPFPIRYLARPNGGKHAALNTGVEAASGEYCAVIDSDDWYEPEALSVLVAVQALCATEGGELTSSHFPGGDRLDSDAFELVYGHGVRGDGIGMIRTEVLRRYPFPELGPECVNESLIWYRIARDYKTRYINRILARKEFQGGGLTATARDQAVTRAPVHRLVFREIVQMRRPMARKERYRAYANWIRNARLSNVPLNSELKDAPSPAMFLFAAPVGVVLASRDRRRVTQLPKPRR
jgi:glycosyltransferase involved in cell wall biosynthesis